MRAVVEAPSDALLSDSEVPGRPRVSAPHESSSPGLFKELWQTGAYLLFPLVFLEMMQIGVIYPVLPTIQRDFFAQRRNGGVFIHCEDFHKDNMPGVCKQGNADAELVSGVVSAVSGTLTFLSSPLVGTLSDTYGRRPFIILSQASSAAPTLLLLLYHRGLFTLWPYIVFNAASGLINSISVLLAFVADTCSPENRGPGFGLVLAFLSFAMLVTPVVGALVPEDTLFVVAVATGGVSILYAAFVMPETLRPELRKPWSRDELNPIKDVSILFRTRLFRRLTACVVFQYFVQQGTMTLLPYYLQDKLDFRKPQISALLISFGAAGIIYNGFVLKQLTKCFSNQRILAMGLFAGFLDKLVYVFVAADWMVYANIGVLAGFASVTFSAISALKSNNVTDSEQGQVQGALYGANAIASALGPLAFSFTYHYLSSAHGSLPAFPAGVFLIAAALTLVACIIALTIPDSGKAEDLMTPRPSRKTDPGYTPQTAAFAKTLDAEYSPLPGPPNLTRMRTFPATDADGMDDDGDAGEAKEDGASLL